MRVVCRGDVVMPGPMAHGPSSSSPFSLLAVACRFPNAGLGCCRFTFCAFMDGFAFATLPVRLCYAYACCLACFPCEF